MTTTAPYCIIYSSATAAKIPRKENTPMKKLIILLLALVMTLGAFAACAGDKPAATTPATPGEDGSNDADKPSNSTPAPGTNNDPSESTPAPGTTNDGQLTDPEKNALNIDLESIDYEGDSFYIYHWNSENPEFEVDADAAVGDPLNDAIYKRNLRLEEDLGITLDFHEETGSAGKQTNFLDKLELRLSDPETPVDIIAAYSRVAPYLLVAGHYVDLMPYEDTLDLSKAWWPSLVREEHEIKGRVFYVSGDASTGLLRMMQALFLNKSLLEQYGYNYDEFMTDVINVKKGSGWTLDKLMSMVKDTYQDIDGVKGESDGDFFGIFGYTWQCIDTLWTGCGYSIFDKSSKDDELYTISNDFGGSAAADFVKQMQEWAATDDAHIVEQGDWTTTSASEHFGSAGCIFMTMRIGHFKTHVVDIDYSVVPAPKKDENQDRYYTVIGNPYSLYSICKDSKDKDRAAIVLQYFGYLAKDLTTPAIFETTFKGKMAKDDHTIDSFDQIRKAVSFDVGRTFDTYTGTSCPNMITDAIIDNIPWSSKLSAATKKMFNKQIQTKLNDKLLGILDSLE